MPIKKTTPSELSKATVSLRGAKRRSNLKRLLRLPSASLAMTIRLVLLRAGLLKETLSLISAWKVPLFLTIASLLLAFNLFCSAKETIKMSQIRQRAGYTFLGDRFRGLEKLVNNAPYLGYATDKNLDDNISARQFAQAQLVLAPTILDLNNLGHEFIIFDYTTPQAAVQKIKELKLQPLKANRYGIILVRNPNRKIP